MLDIDGVLTRHHADTTDVLAAAQQMAVSAIGDLLNKGTDPNALHKAADAIAEQIRAALHARNVSWVKTDATGTPVDDEDDATQTNEEASQQGGQGNGNGGGNSGGDENLEG